MALKHYKNSDSTVFNDAKALFDLNKSIHEGSNRFRENKVGNKH